MGKGNTQFKPVFMNNFWALQDILRFYGETLITINKKFLPVILKTLRDLSSIFVLIVHA